MSDTSDIRMTFAAAVYTPKTGNRETLHRFVESLKVEGINVAGILQKKLPMSEGDMSEVVAINIRTGKHLSLNRPTRESWENRECSLDTTVLVEATAILRRAITDGAELIVVEKFGDEEKKGGGLSDEIFNGIASGIPFLVAVPETNLDAWIERTGGAGAVLTFDESALWNWWNAIDGSVRVDRR